jgi:hypothetical protein
LEEEDEALEVEDAAEATAEDDSAEMKAPQLKS